MPATASRIARTRIDLADPVRDAYRAICRAMRGPRKPTRFVVAADTWPAVARLRHPGTGVGVLDPGIFGEYRMCGLPVSVSTRPEDRGGVFLESERG